MRPYILHAHTYSEISTIHKALVRISAECRTAQSSCVVGGGGARYILPRGHGQLYKGIKPR